MQNLTASNKRLKSVTEHIGLLPKHHNHTNQSDKPANIPVPPITNQQPPNPNSGKQTFQQHRPQNSSGLASSEDNLLPNSRPIKAHSKQHKDIDQSRKLSDIPKGIPQHNYRLPQSAHQQKRLILDAFKRELIHRDQSDHPLKYKIVSQQLGFDPAKIYKLKQSELSRIHQQYQRGIGLQYLRQAQRNVRIKTEKSQTASNPRAKGKVEFRKRTKSQKVLRTRKTALQQLREKEDIMGKIVYEKVKRHLRQEKVSNDFSQRVHSQEAIDRALIDFLKLKIERAEASFKHT